MYNLDCSHSIMSKELAEELGLVIEPSGTVITHSFMGNSRQEAYKTKANIKTINKDFIQLDFLVGKCYQDLPRYNYEIPEHWAQNTRLRSLHLVLGDPIR